MENNLESEFSTQTTRSENNKNSSSKILTFGMIGSAVLLLGAVYFYMTNNSQPAKTVAPARTHALSSNTIKSKLKQLGVHFDKNHLKAINSSDDKIEIYVNEEKITLNKRQYVDFEIKSNTGQIFIAQKDIKLGFVFEIDENKNLLSTHKIQFLPASVGIKDVAVKDIPKDLKVETSKTNENSLSSSSSDSVSSSEEDKGTADFCDNAKITDNSDEMRETFKGIAHNLNLGPLEMLLGPAMPRIVQNSQKIKVGSEYVNYVTTEDGNGTLGEYLPDILQKDQMNLGAMSLNMKKAMQDSNYSKIIVNKTTTAIYPSDLDSVKAKKIIGCF